MRARGVPGCQSAQVRQPAEDGHQLSLAAGVRFGKDCGKLRSCGRDLDVEPLRYPLKGVTAGESLREPGLGRSEFEEPTQQRFRRNRKVAELGKQIVQWAKRIIVRMNICQSATTRRDTFIQHT